MPCNLSRALGVSSTSLGISRESFRTAAKAWRKLIKAANPAIKMGTYGQNHALGHGADKGSLAFMATGDFRKFIDNLDLEVKPSKTFIRGLRYLRDVGRNAFMMGGRGYFLEAAGGGKTDNILSRAILWPNRALDAAYQRWHDLRMEQLRGLFEKYEIEPRSDKAKMLGRLLNEDTAGKELSPKNQEMVNEFRAFLNQLHLENNAYRAKVGRKTMEYRKNYFPHIRRVTSIFRQLQEDASVVATDENGNTILADFLENAESISKNVSAKARKNLLDEGVDLDPTSVLSEYITMIGKDIFEHEGARHNIAHIRAIKQENQRRMKQAEAGQSARVGEESRDPSDLLMNLEADLIEYTSTHYMNLDPLMTRWFKAKFGENKLAMNARKAAIAVHHGLIQAVFPFNWKWSLLIQPQSALLIPVRYGHTSTIKAARKLMDRTEREKLLNTTYSILVKKGAGGGSFSEQTTGSRDTVKDDRFRRRGAVAEFLMNNGGQGFVKHWDSARKAGNWMADAMETNLSLLAAMTAKISGEQMGLTGRALDEYISEGVMKTQSMYDFKNRAGILQSPEVNALIPFQSFYFELFNTMREIGVPIKKVRNVMQPTGAYKEYDTDSQIGALTVSARVQAWSYMLGGAAVANLIVGALDDREPWHPTNSIPFSTVIFGGPFGRSPILPAQYMTEWAQAFQSYVEYGDTKKTRDMFLRYHAMGGLQAKRTLDGLEALYHGGIEDRRGRTLVPIGPEDALAALIAGPWKTGPAREYWDRQEKR